MLSILNTASSTAVARRCGRNKIASGVFIGPRCSTQASRSLLWERLGNRCPMDGSETSPNLQPTRSGACRTRKQRRRLGKGDRVDWSPKCPSARLPGGRQREYAYAGECRMSWVTFTPLADLLVHWCTRLFTLRSCDLLMKAAEAAVHIRS
jgi:hypothetical protein